MAVEDMYQLGYNRADTAILLSWSRFRKPEEVLDAVADEMFGFTKEPLFQNMFPDKKEMLENITRDEIYRQLLEATNFGKRVPEGKEFIFNCYMNQINDRQLLIKDGKIDSYCIFHGHMARKFHEDALEAAFKSAQNKGIKLYLVDCFTLERGFLCDLMDMRIDSCTESQIILAEASFPKPKLFTSMPGEYMPRRRTQEDIAKYDSTVPATGVVTQLVMDREKDIRGRMLLFKETKTMVEQQLNEAVAFYSKALPTEMYLHDINEDL